MFNFIKYTNPGSYYRLAHKMPHAVLSFPTELPTNNPYSSLKAWQIDASYKALQEGVVPEGSKNELQNEVITSTKDNYIFIRRYFGKMQVLNVLILRLITLHNPILEIWTYLSTRRIQRVQLKPKITYDWESFDSTLVRDQPLVSVIIPTLNRYEYLKDVLKDLEAQEYKNFEVIICDQSEPSEPYFYKGWNLTLTVIQQNEKALWLARNKCVAASKGEYILLFDDDSRVAKDWISQHLRCVDFFKTTISAGVTNTLVGGGLSKKESYFHSSDVFDTGNALVHRSVFEKAGLFDRQFEKQRMGDSEFGLRALLNGFKIISNPFASRIHLKVETGGLRQLGSWDAWRPKSLLAPRPIPSVLYLFRRYHGNAEAILFVMKNIPLTYLPYKFKRNRKLKAVFMLLFPFFLPLAIISVSKSWQLASVKLKEGDKITSLV